SQDLHGWNALTSWTGHRPRNDFMIARSPSDVCAGQGSWRIFSPEAVAGERAIMKSLRGR
ncbi:hypothetical protein, partial [Streptomyces sp. NPDC047123]|uniref:hypothetical protein n=1 Tax=Streptomyces sp. NPDC047123 TaxID=3155622 RepID=UPI0033CEC0F6